MFFSYNLLHDNPKEYEKLHRISIGKRFIVDDNVYDTL